MKKKNKNNSFSSAIWNINRLFFILFYALLILGSNTINAQDNYTITHEDSLALENVIVEKYYVSVASDYSDTEADALPKGSVTYRIFIDMRPGYSLQAMYGTQKHQLYMKTSTTFFNDKVCFAETGFNIDAKQLHKDNVALDSWITMGAASRLHTGILRSEDDSVFSFITNRYTLSKIDGLTKGVLPKFQIYNIDLKFFNNDSTASEFIVNDGAWAAMGGVKGPTPENRVLIAQLTTSGKLSYGLNVQIGTPTGGYIQFVAKDPEGSEIQFNGLTNN
jgi:hypothetical protein